VGRAARVPEPAGGFTPHVALAYSNTDGPSEPSAAALAAVGPRTAIIGVGAIRAISLVRDTHLYRWETVATAPLAPGPRRPPDAEPPRALAAGPGGSGLGKSGWRAYVGFVALPSK
jgi:hypothetical protein